MQLLSNKPRICKQLAMRTIICLLSSLIVAMASPVAVVPAATSYVHRTDHISPGQYLAGALGPQLPGSFYAPIPIAQTLDFGHQPLPQIVKNAEFIEGDYLEDVDRQKHDLAEDNEEEHYSKRGEKVTTGHNSKDHHAARNSRNYESHHNEGHDTDNDGEHSRHHDEEDSHAHKKESGKKHNGHKHGHKRHHSNGEEVTGYHKQFHKDEYKKDHDFYDIANRQGSFSKHGKKHGKSKNEHGSHKKGKNSDAGRHEKDFGKLDAYDKKVIAEYEVSHATDEDRDENDNEHQDYSTVGKKTKSREHGYNDDNNEDDLDDDDDDDDYYED